VTRSILSPEDRVVLWRSTIDAEGHERTALLASQWREHVLGRRRTEPDYVSVGDVAARYGVTTQAVYKWLKDGRIEATRGPGGSWRIPAAQFDRDQRPATSRQKLDALKQQLITVHEGSELPDEDDLTASLRAED
jgi:excisionase family DNA binding protein